MCSCYIMNTDHFVAVLVVTLGQSGLERVQYLFTPKNVYKLKSECIFLPIW